MTSLIRRFDGIIFDADGTLIDSNSAHAEAWVEALSEAGYPTTFEILRPLIGMGGDKILPLLTGLQADSPAGKQIADRRGEIFRDRSLATLEAFPATRELLERLRQDGFKLAVASSASPKDLGALLVRADVADLFSRQSSADDAENSKPDPDIVRDALDKLGLPAARTAMIGDTPYDAEAARRAGVALFAFRCGGHWRDTDFGAVSAIYDGAADLLGRLESSALYREEPAAEASRAP